MPDMGYQTRFSIASAATYGLVWAAASALTGWVVYLASGSIWFSSTVGTAVGFLLLRRILSGEASRRNRSVRTLRRASDRIKEQETADRHAELAAHGLNPLSKP